MEFLGFSRGSLEELKRDFEEIKRELEEGLRRDAPVMRQDIEELLTLIYGQDCMFGRQIRALEEKMANEKTLPASEMIKRSWAQARSAENRFWQIAKDRFGIIRDEKGLIRENKGE